MAFKMSGWSAFAKNRDDDKKKKIEIVFNPGKKDSLNKEPKMNVIRKNDNSKCAPGQKCIDPWKELEDNIRATSK